MSLNSSHGPLLYQCFDSQTAVFIFTAFAGSKILLCGPLCILVLYTGQQLRSSRTTSHSDVFTYHMVAMELESLAAFLVYFSGTYAKITILAKAGLYFSTIAYAGEMWFHCLTCAERYLAVFHPIAYQGLKHSKGVKIRNISIGCVWIMGLAWVGVVSWNAPKFPIIQFFCFMAFALVVVSFCSLSVLCALVHPRLRCIGQTKRRAFHTIVVILAVLWFWFIGIIVNFALGASQLLNHSDGCTVIMFGLCFMVPGSLVLPLLFLHRAGKLQRRHNRNQ